MGLSFLVTPSYHQHWQERLLICFTYELQDEMNHRNEFVLVKASTDKYMMRFAIIKWCDQESQSPTQGMVMDYVSLEPAFITTTQRWVKA